MWPPNAITITLEDIDGDTVLVLVTSPVGFLEILCEATFRGRSLHLTRSIERAWHPGISGVPG